MFLTQAVVLRSFEPSSTGDGKVTIVTVGASSRILLGQRKGRFPKEPVIECHRSKKHDPFIQGQTWYNAFIC